MDNVIEGCPLGFICEQKWDDLAETDKDAVRHCSVCNTDVHWCDSLKELRAAKRKKWCVAYDYNVNGPPLVGMMTKAPLYPPEDLLCRYNDSTDRF